LRFRLLRDLICEAALFGLGWQHSAVFARAVLVEGRVVCGVCDRDCDRVVEDNRIHEYAVATTACLGVLLSERHE
jgi:hypothetical protein